MDSLTSWRTPGGIRFFLAPASSAKLETNKMDEFLIGLRESVEAGASTVEIKSGHYKITASSKSGVFVTKWPRPNANTKRFYRHVIATSGGVRPDIYALAKRVKQILADDAELSQLADICKRRARGNCHAR